MKSPHPQLDKLIAQDPDLVDRIFDYLVAEFPQIRGKAEDLKASVREEFQGEECYIRGRSLTERQERVQQVLALFNGRNAREVARRLNIGRTTVYRIVKQAGGPARTEIPGSGTTTPLRSATATERPQHASEPTEPAPCLFRPTTSRPSTPPSPAESSPSATTGARSRTAR